MINCLVVSILALFSKNKVTFINKISYCKLAIETFGSLEALLDALHLQSFDRLH